MKRSMRVLAAAAVALALAGCATPVALQRDQVGQIRRDASPEEVDRVLGKATVTAQFEFDAQGGKYFARHFNLQTGRRAEQTMVCTTFCFPVYYDVPIMSEYVVIQRLPARAIHAWGTLEELSKDPDPQVSALMPAVKQRYGEELKNKKK
jgi:hypothetical protein